MTLTDEKKLLKKKRIIALVSLAILIALICFITYISGIRFSKIAKSGVEFDEYIKGFGWFGGFIAVGIQILQVIVAIIPGEIVEIGIGYSYGWFWGTLLCLTGVAIGSSLIFLLVKKYGIRFVELFVSADKINELKFINSERKLKRTTFILFFIPGTPKDLLTYFVGLTRMTLSEFLSITLVARIPSVVSSAIGGHFMENKQYIEALIIFIAIAAISLIGINLYKIVIVKAKKKIKNHKKRKNKQV